MSTSYPYLHVAKVFEVCYSKVLNFIDELEKGLDVKVKSGERMLLFWELKAYDAWMYECYRRSQVS